MNKSIENKENNNNIKASGGAGELTWRLTNGGTLIISGNGEMSKYTWSSYRDSIISVIIENGITNIGNWAFCECENLTSISIASSVTTIKNNAFFLCGNLSSIDIDKDNSVYSSENGILFDKSKSIILKYPPAKPDIIYIIPDSVINIGFGAFSACTGLISVTIGNGITTIEGHAFKYCKNLAYITISNSVTNISKCAFCGCRSLISISVDVGNSYYASKYGVLFDKSEKTVIQYPKGKTGNYIISNNATSIEGYAFCQCKLTSITIPNTITEIGERVFYNSNSLNYINVDKNNPTYTFVNEGLFDNADRWKYFKNILTE